MRKLSPLVLAPWTLPLIVLAIAVPIVAGFALAGPSVGLAVGAIAAGAVIVLAARTRYEEPIEVAAPRAGEYHALVVATTDLDAASAAAVADAVREGVRTTGSEGSPPRVLVLAPVEAGSLARLTSDLEAPRLRAQERLAVSVAALAAAGIDARGEVGDPDPVQASEDVLATFPAREVLLVETREAGERTLDQLRRRLDRRLRRIEAPGGA